MRVVSLICILSLSLLHAGCDSEVMLGDDPADIQNRIILGGMAGTGMNSDPFEINSAEMYGSVLSLNVSYSGGCVEHDFSFYSSEVVLLSLPAQVGVGVTHDGHDDNCEAYLTENVKVDISPLIEQIGGPFWMNIFPVGSRESIRVLYEDQ